MVKYFYFLVILLNVISFDFGFAQNPPKINDTLSTVTLEKFNVPPNRYIVLTNIRDIKFEAEVLNENLEKIRDCGEFWQDPAQSEFPVAGPRGKLVQFLVKESIETIGRYYLKVKINYRDEEVSNSIEGYYQIDVGYPTIAAPVELRNEYYFSENKTFSFSTNEYSNAQGYSYKIFESGASEISEGEGPVVSLDSLLNNPNNIGRKFTIKGYYEGKEFQYLSASSESVQTSSWEFSVQKPQLDEFVSWKKKDEKTDQLISIYNDRAMSFLYVYIGKTPTGFVVVEPEMKNLRVNSVPSGFIKNFKTQSSGKFLLINLDISEDFMNQMEECGEEDIDLNIQFTTQFGEKIEREYTTTVIK